MNPSYLYNFEKHKPIVTNYMAAGFVQLIHQKYRNLAYFLEPICNNSMISELSSHSSQLIDLFSLKVHVLLSPTYNGVYMIMRTEIKCHESQSMTI